MPLITAGDFRRCELFVAGVYRGLSYFLANSRYGGFVGFNNENKTREVKVKYVSELLYLLNPSGAVLSHSFVTPTLTDQKIPRKDECYSFERHKSSIDLEYCIDNLSQGETFDGEVSDINSTTAERYFHSSSALIPSCLLALMSNLAAASYKGSIVPVYLSQPDMNNRKVNIEHVYDSEKANLPVRSDNDWGTMETAWGDSPFNMSATKAVAVFYEVRMPNSRIGVGINQRGWDDAKVVPCLKSISEQKLIGDPYARHLTLESAKSFWMLMSGEDPKQVFGDFLEKNVRKPEESVAQCLVISTLTLMRLRFNSLRAYGDWLHLYYHLEKLLQTKFHYGQTPVQIFTDDRPVPKSMLDVRMGVWSMINFLTPIRIAFLDAQRRNAGCIYAMMQTFPENGLEDLDSRRTSEDVHEYMTAREPKMEKMLSDVVTTDFLIPVVASRMQNPEGVFSVAELRLCKQHSEFIQRSTTVAKKRSLADALLSLCIEIRNAGLAISAELVYRKEGPKDKNEKRKQKDSLKNENHITEIREFVLKELMKDSSEALSNYSVIAFKHEAGKSEKANENGGDSEVAEEGSVPQSTGALKERVDLMVETNRKYLKDIRVGGMYTRKTTPPTRTDLNMIAILFGNFIHSPKSVECFIEIINVNGGSKAMDIVLQEDCFRNQESLVMGSKVSTGKLYGVRAENSSSNFE